MPRLSLKLLCALALVLCSVLPSMAATLTVTTLLDDGSPGTLRSLIASAAPGDTITFGVTGTIQLACGFDRGGLFIYKNLTISGPGPANLVISGGGGCGVFEINSGVTVGISGVTIQNGNNYYGAVLNGGTLTLSNSTLSGNSGLYGGAIYNYFGVMTLTNSTVSGNSAQQGGGIYNGYGAVLTVTNSTLSGNSAALNGGAVYNEPDGGPLTVTGSTLSGNSAAFNGGGIKNSYRGLLIVTNSTLSGNFAIQYDGGGILNQGTLTLTNSTLSGNSAGSSGGGVLNNNNDGYLYPNIKTGVLNVTNSTLSGNSAAVSGGGIYNNLGLLTIKSTIIANSSSGANCFNPGFTSAGYNLSDDNSCPFAQKTDLNSMPAGLDPGGLKNNGGPTQTIALLSGSPAVDAIPTKNCTDVAGTPVTTDQRGVLRPQVRACDIGAFELGQLPPDKLEVVTAGPTPRFDLRATFTLAATSNGINPLTEDVTLEVGTYGVTLPAGSFKLLKNGGYAYQGTVNNVSLQIQIIPLGGSSFQIYAQATPVAIPPTNPVTVTITIGDDIITKSVTATFN